MTTTDSIKNWSIITEFFAPMAFRSPTSWIRWLTEMSIEADKVRDEVRKALDNPIAKTLAVGVAICRGFKTPMCFDVTTEGDLVLSEEVPVKGPLPEKAPRKSKGAKAERLKTKKAPTAQDIKAAAQVLPEIHKPSKGKKGKSSVPKVGKSTLKGLYPSVKELRELAAQVGAKIDGIAPQNKKAMLAAIKAAKTP